MNKTPDVPKGLLNHDFDSILPVYPQSVRFTHPSSLGEGRNMRDERGKGVVEHPTGYTHVWGREGRCFKMDPEWGFWRTESGRSGEEFTDVLDLRGRVSSTGFYCRLFAQGKFLLNGR